MRKTVLLKYMYLLNKNCFSYVDIIELGQSDTSFTPPICWPCGIINYLASISCSSKGIPTYLNHNTILLVYPTQLLDNLLNQTV